MNFKVGFRWSKQRKNHYSNFNLIKNTWATAYCKANEIRGKTSKYVLLIGVSKQNLENIVKNV